MRALLMAVLAATALAAVGCSVYVAQGSGKVVSETRDVSGITSVSLECSGVLSIAQGGTESLVVEADDNILPHIKTDVQDGRLSIHMTPGTIVEPSAPMRFTLSVIRLEGLAVSGSGSASVDSLSTPAMSVAVGGSGGVSVSELETGSVAVAISGSGDVSIGGRADSQSVAVSGSGSYDGSQMTSREASVAVSGSGDVALWVTDKLDAEISGSGSVAYYGDPVVDKRVSGSGSIRSLGARGVEL